MKKNILIIPGDGIGQEVTSWGKKVLIGWRKIMAMNLSLMKPPWAIPLLKLLETRFPNPLRKAKSSNTILLGLWAI